MKRIFIPVLVVLVAASVLFGAAEAAAEAPVLKRILDSGELRVGLSGNQPPYNAKSRTGELMGLEVDLANMLAGAFGVKATFVAKPFPELMAALAASEVDVVMSGMAITPERSLEAAFVGPYLISGKSILTNSKALAAAKQAGEFNRANLKLAALANSTSQKFVELNIPEATLVKVQDYDAAVNMVINDEVDALVADMPICLLSVMRYPGKGLATLNQPLSVEPIGIALSPSDPQFRTLLDNYMSAFEGTGLLQQLRKKWLEDGSWIPALP
jgi:polar amino acid transport system substrate-binding protein